MKRFLKFTSIFAFVIYNLAFSIIVRPVFALCPDPNDPTCPGNQPPSNPPSKWLNSIPLGGLKLPTGDLTSATSQVLPFIVSALLYIVIILALVFLVIGGITWITSGGDKEALAKAKSTVTYAIIGLVLGLSSFLILSLLESFFQLGTMLLGQRSFIPQGTFGN